MSAAALELPVDCPLTPMEWRGLLCLCDGMTYGQIALRHGQAVSTVRTQLHNAFGKLNVTGGMQAVAYAFRAGWVHEPDPIIPIQVYEAKLPPSQWAYIAAFDDYTRSRARRDRARMVVSFYGVQLDLKLKPRPPVRVYHPELRLLKTILCLADTTERLRIARHIGLDIHRSAAA